MKSRCFVGATRTTRRRSSPSAERVRHRIVSLENPLEAGASTPKTSGPFPPGVLVASQRVRVAATSSGSRWSMSGTGRHSIDVAAGWERSSQSVPLLDYQLSDGIATIKLDDGKVNALSLAMQAEIGAAIDRAAADDAAIVLTGRPGMFSAGFDLATIGGGGAAAGEMVIGGFRLAQRLLTHPRPVVVGCTGHAIAMGTFLMFAADYRIGPVDGSYRWIANEVAIGLTMPRAAIEMLRFRLTPGAVDKAVILSHTFGPDDALEQRVLRRVGAVGRRRGHGDREGAGGADARRTRPRAEQVAHTGAGARRTGPGDQGGRRRLRPLAGAGACG